MKFHFCKSFENKIWNIIFLRFLWRYNISYTIYPNSFTIRNQYINQNINLQAVFLPGNEIIFLQLVLVRSYYKSAMYKNGSLFIGFRAKYISKMIYKGYIDYISSQFQVIIIKFPTLQNKNYWQSAKTIISLNAQKHRPF